MQAGAYIFGVGDKVWADTYGEKSFGSFLITLRAFFAHFAIRLYVGTALISGAAYVFAGGAWSMFALAGLVSLLGYPLVEYGLHRFVLHATFLCRWTMTAPLWRRLHYDHHMEPNDLSVLFADPKTSLPLLAVLALFAAVALQSPAWFLAMLATNCMMFLYYEFMHMMAHVPHELDVPWLKRRKQSHLRHHFVDERQDFGIGTSLVDKFSRHRPQAGEARSETVRNLGYTDALADRYPWVRNGYEQRTGKERSC